MGHYRMLHFTTAKWSILRATGLILVMLLLPANTALSQSEEQSNEKPSHLVKRSDAADVNLMAQVFGTIALSAAGLIDIDDVISQYRSDGTMSDRTDSVIAAMMMAYNGTVVLIMGFGVLILVHLMAFQAGLEGKVLTERYNSWSVIRSFYALMAVLPLIGGWSLGQYGILTAVMFGSNAANGINEIGNRHTYSTSSLTAPPLPRGPATALVESMYLSEICRAIVNRHLEGNDEERLEAIRQHREEADRISNMSTSYWGGTMTSARNQAATVLAETRPDLSGYLIEGKPVSEEEASQINLWAFTWDGTHDFKWAWGSEKIKEDACGYVAMNIDAGDGDFDKGDQNRQHVVTYQRAQVETLRIKATEIAIEVDQVVAILERLSTLKNEMAAMPGDIPPSMALIIKRLREELNNTSPDFKPLRALAHLINPNLNLTISQGNYDELIIKQSNALYAEFLGHYSDATSDNAQAFDDQLLLLRRLQAADQLRGYLGKESGIYGFRDDAYSSQFVDNRDSDEDTANDHIESMHDYFHPLVVNTQKGWLYAGFKWWDLSRAQTFAYQLQKIQPTYSPFYAHIDSLSKYPTIKADLLKATETISRLGEYRTAAETLARNEMPDSIELIEKLSNEYSDDAAGLVSQYQSIIGDMILQAGDATLFDFQEKDLLSDIQATGHAYIWISGALWMLSKGLETVADSRDAKANRDIKKQMSSFAKKVAPGKSGKLLSGALKTIAGLSSYLAIVLFVVGVIYAFYLPMLPAILWVFGIVDWLRKIAESLIAQPMWHASHIMPGDQGLTNQNSRMGYLINVALAITPMVMMFSLYLSHITLSAVGFLLQDMMDSFIPSMNKGFASGIVTPIMSLVVFSGFLVALTHRILAWIYEIPENIPNYFGGSPIGLGTERSASKFGEHLAILASKTEAGSSMAMTPNKESIPTSQPAKQKESNDKF